jgi:hypothetical protein
MTFRQLIASLPNGLHDAELRRFEMDYEGRRLQFDLMVWVGDLSSPHGRELYRPAFLTFRDVAYLIVESPSADSVPLMAETIRIDAGEGRPARSSSEIPTAPANTSVTWIYLGEPNTFLIFAAGEASLEWTGLAESREPAL